LEHVVFSLEFPAALSSWLDFARYLRVAFRGCNYPGLVVNWLGFRCAR
jgi:formylglycine-generating enzyme required for sulfatase activity